MFKTHSVLLSPSASDSAGVAEDKILAGSADAVRALGNQLNSGGGDDGGGEDDSEVIDLNEGAPVSENGSIDDSTPTDDSTDDKSAEEIEAAKVEADATKKLAADVKLQQQQQLKNKSDIPVPHPDSIKTTRDYTKFDEADVPALKAMPNAAFKHFEGRLPALTSRAVTAEKQLKEVLANNGVPPSWNEHDEAYSITPHYREAAHQYNLHSLEASHAAEMIELLGKSDTQMVKKMVSFNNDGNPEFSDIAVNDTNREQLKKQFTLLYGKTSAKAEEAANKANQIQQTWKEKGKKLREDISKAEDDVYFPFYKEGADGFTLAHKKFIKDAIETFPREVQDSPLARPLAKSYLLIQEMNNIIKKLRSGKAPAATKGKSKTIADIAAENKLAGAASHKIGDAGGDDSEEMLDHSEFLK